MNAFLAILRRIALGGIVLLVLSLVLKGALPAGNLGKYLIACPFAYLILQFFSWLSAKHATDEISEELGLDIESNNYFVTLLRGLIIDVFSPLMVIITLFRDTSVKWVMFIATYAIILAYAGIWFFVIR